MNAKIQLFQEKKKAFFIDFFYIRSQGSVVSSQRPEVKTFLYLCPKINDMNTTTLQITFTNTDLSVFEPLFKKFKLKTKVIQEEKDETEMTKEAFFAKVDRARKGKMIHMSREEMKKLIKNN